MPYTCNKCEIFAAGTKQNLESHQRSCKGKPTVINGSGRNIQLIEGDITLICNAPCLTGFILDKLEQVIKDIKKECDSQRKIEPIQKPKESKIKKEKCDICGKLGIIIDNDRCESCIKSRCEIQKREELEEQKFKDIKSKKESKICKNGHELMKDEDCISGCTQKEKDKQKEKEVKRREQIEDNKEIKMSDDQIEEIDIEIEDELEDHCTICETKIRCGLKFCTICHDKLMKDPKCFICHTANHTRFTPYCNKCQKTIKT